MDFPSGYGAKQAEENDKEQGRNQNGSLLSSSSILVPTGGGIVSSTLFLETGQRKGDGGGGGGGFMNIVTHDFNNLQQEQQQQQQQQVGRVGNNGNVHHQEQQQQQQQQEEQEDEHVLLKNTPSSNNKKKKESSFFITGSAATTTTTCSPHQNPSVLASASSSSLVGVDREELVTINNTNKSNMNSGTASDLLFFSSSLSSSPSSHNLIPSSNQTFHSQQYHHHQQHEPEPKVNHAYNAVFLVDGLHKGIRIDNQGQSSSSSSSSYHQPDRHDQQHHHHPTGPLAVTSSTSSTTTTSPLSTKIQQGGPEFGGSLPTTTTTTTSVPQPASSFGLPSPPPASSPVLLTNKRNHNSESHHHPHLHNYPSIKPESSLSSPSSASTCIRISQVTDRSCCTLGNINQVEENNGTIIRSPLVGESVISPNESLNNTSSAGRRNEIPDQFHSLHSPVSTTTTTAGVVEQQSNSNNNMASRVLLPVPSFRTPVPNTTNSQEQQRVISIATGGGGGRTPPASTIIPGTPSTGATEQIVRTLISTEAQTDSTDLAGATTSGNSDNSAPQQPSRTNREHRKRERRERHLRRSSNNNNHHHHQSHHHASQTPGSDRDRTTSNCHGTRDTPASRSEHRISRRTQPEGGSINNNNARPEIPSRPSEELLLSAGGGSGGTDNGSDSLPDLLHSHQPPPPPYSTLPPPLHPPPSIANRPYPNVHPPSGISPPPVHPMALPIVSMPTVLTGAPGPHLQIPVQLPLAPPPPPPPVLVPQPSTCLQTATQAPTIRYHFSPAIRANRGSMRGGRSGDYGGDDEPKTCCGMSTSQTVSIRWFIVVIAVIGICCTVVGTTLGAAYSNGREHLTLSLLMIGVGIVLLTVSAVAWRLTSHDADSSCPSLLGFTRNLSSRGDGGTEPNRRFVPRLAPSYGRPHHPYAAMMYPEFQYRPPPPSYQASMQEYRLRLLLLERSNPTIAAAATLASTSALTMAPPPPAYRPYTGTLRPALSNRNDPDLSRPPSYRSRSSGNNGPSENALCGRASLDPSAGHHHHHHHHLHHVMLDSPLHSRNPSLLSYLSQQSMGDNVSVVSGHGTPSNGTVVTVMQAVSVGMDLGLEMYEAETVHHHHGGMDGDDKGIVPEGTVVVGELSEEKDNDGSGGRKDGNLVRIVQTTDSSQVIGRDSVIVTVSGSNQTLWDQSLQHANNQHNNSNNTANRLAIHHHHQPSPTIMAIHGSLTSPPPSQQPQQQQLPQAPTSVQDQQQQQQQTPSSSQVQILAHL